MQVLVLDDDRRVRGLLSRLLKRLQHRPLCASTVEEARGIVQSERVDFVISDVVMPEETGADFHRWLVETGSGLVENMVFFSGGASDPELLSYIENTGCPLYAKPEVMDMIAAIPALAPPN